MTATNRERLVRQMAEVMLRPLGIDDPLHSRISGAEHGLRRWAEGKDLNGLRVMLLATPQGRWRSLFRFVFAECPRVTQQDALANGWAVSSAAVAAAARGELIRWFRIADFRDLLLPNPEMDISALPESFEAYRGASGVSAQSASLGASWSLRRDVAAHFAIRRGARGGNVVLRRTVQRAEVLYKGDVHADEVVLPPPHSGAWSVVEMTKYEMELLSLSLEMRVQAAAESMPANTRALYAYSEASQPKVRASGVVLQ